jgi:DNA-binding MarR family transcriptional regulator
MESALPDSPLLDPLDQLPGFALRRAAHVMMGDLSARIATVDMRLSDATVLLLVTNRQDMTSSDIGKVLDIKRANMVPLLNRLESAGLIVRQPIDRKSMAIVLTAQGLAKLAEVQRVTAAFEADLIARVPAEHRAHLMPALIALWR